jgi:hypothetical protein
VHFQYQNNQPLQKDNKKVNKVENQDCYENNNNYFLERSLSMNIFIH